MSKHTSKYTRNYSVDGWPIVKSSKILTLQAVFEELIESEREISELKDKLGYECANSELAYSELNTAHLSIQELAGSLNEAAELIEGWSDIHKFDDWNRSDKYRALANQCINKEEQDEI